VGGFTAAVQRFGIGRLAAVLGVAAGVAAVLVAVMMRIGQAPDALLYSNLDLREASEITTALDAAGIKHSAKGDGSTIFVSRDEVGTARMLLAGKGLVTQGSVGYEIFDEQSVLGQTEFQQNLNAKRALEGELARDIMSLRGVSMARVRIALPERALFQADAAEPTASVVVGLGGREMTAENVRAIRNLVASAVPNLKPNRVTVVDDMNRTLAAGGEDDGFGAGAEQAKAGTERQLQARIMDIVEGVVGPGAARVQVTAEIDHSRQTTQELRYDPDGQVVRSTATNGSTAQDTSAQSLGGATATENIPGGEGPETAQVGSSQQDTSETINYEISNTTTTTVKEPGEVRRLAVAVAVDGKWTPGADGAEATYAPRTPEEIAQIKALVGAAVGIDETRGDKLEVTNVRFDRAALPDGGTEAGGGMFDFGKNDVMRGVELLILLITGVLLIFFVLRPLLKAATSGGAAQAAGGGAVLPAGPGVTQLQTVTVGGGGGIAGQLTGPTEMEQRLDIARIEGQVKASSVRKVADFVEKHPEESTSILRSWVHEG
jgi:flagellar M-ring protein FliF